MSNDCIFCKLVAGEIPSTKVYEDDYVYAFDDIEPEAPVHVLVVPKTHYHELNGEVPAEALGHIMAAIPKVAKIKGVDESGFRCIINVGPDSAQTVPHMHCARHRRCQDGSCHLRRLLARTSINAWTSERGGRCRLPLAPFSVCVHLCYHARNMMPCTVATLVMGPHTVRAGFMYRMGRITSPTYRACIRRETGLAYDVQGKAPTSQ